VTNCAPACGSSPRSFWFIYLFIAHTAWSPRAMAGMERKEASIKASTKAAKQMCESKRASQTKEILCLPHAQLYKKRVVSHGDTPSQGCRWCCILYWSSRAWLFFFFFVQSYSLILSAVPPRKVGLDGSTLAPPPTDMDLAVRLGSPPQSFIYLFIYYPYSLEPVGSGR